MEQPIGGYHRPVLLEETLAALDVRPDGTYLDGTAGGGGHAFAVASRLKNGRLIALDQDPDAVEEASAHLRGCPRRWCVPISPLCGRCSLGLGIGGVDGILLDIGVSSHQLDTPERVFLSRRRAAGHADEQKRQDGGGSHSRPARTGTRRALFPIRGGKTVCPPHRPRHCAGARERTGRYHRRLGRTGQRGRSAAARRDGHPARRVFRRCASRSMGNSTACRKDWTPHSTALNEGGRLAVITFHSLEDRMVKQRFAEWRKGCTCPPDFPVCVCGRTPAAEPVLRRPATASQRELEENPRSRSAKLRCIRKCHERYR